MYIILLWTNALLGKKGSYVISFFVSFKFYLTYQFFDDLPKIVKNN